jgi:hypothetical protein
MADLDRMHVPTGKLRRECGSAFRLGGIHRRLADDLGPSRGPARPARASGLRRIAMQPHDFGQLAGLQQRSRMVERVRGACTLLANFSKALRA